MVFIPIDRLYFYKAPVTDSPVSGCRGCDRNHSGALQRNRSCVFKTIGILLILFVSSNALGANVPNFDKPVDFNVREQNINAFLNALFQEIDVPVSINSKIEGNVNGKFKNTARNVFDEVSNAFSLTVYFDGAVAQIYRKNEVSRKLLAATPSMSNRVVAIAQKMNLPDANNSVVSEDTGLVLSGTEKFISQIEQLVASVKPVPVKTPAPKIIEVEKLVSFPDESPVVYQVFKLKHAWAIDTQIPVGGRSVVIPGVATILKELIQSGEPLSTVVTDEGDNSLTGLRGKGLKKSPGANELRTEIDQTSKDAARIVADSRLNAIVIRDKQDKMKAYGRLIDTLDVESGMVEIEATIIDINTDKSQELGINWRYQEDNVDVLFGQGSTADRALVSGGGAITSQGQGGILSFSLGQPANFLARVRALEQRGAAKIVSKPHVITLSDVEGVLAATTEFFVRVAGDQEVDLFNVPVGTTLRVTPHIFRDNNINKIKLLVNIEDGTQSTGASVDNIPVVERATISTQAVVNEGDSLLVGGLVRETFRNTNYQVPVLGSIPLIGGLFKSKQKQATRVERLFMITPRLASGFPGDKNNSALSGSQSNIISDAASRISREGDIGRSAIEYWSEESVREQANQANGLAINRKVVQNPLSNVVQAEKAQKVVMESVFATMKNNVFISPFKVENWSVE